MRPGSFTSPWRGSIGGLRPPSVYVKNADAERRLWRSAAGWGESARSALRLPASPRTPPRAPAVRDPPPCREGETKHPRPAPRPRYKIGPNLGKDLLE